MPRIRLAVLPVALLVFASLRAEPAVDSTSRITSPAVRKQAAEDLESCLRRDLDDGQLHHFTLFQAALIAGGVQSFQDLQDRTSRFDEFRHSISAELASITDQSSKLDLLHRRLHERILTGEYRADYSELPRTLDEGHFNCVTATILFQVLCESCGVETFAIATQSHVLCRVPGPPTFYVETTCRDWRLAAVDGTQQRTQGRVRDSRDLSSVQLIGKVYYNSGVTQLEARQFAKAADLFVSAQQLDHQDQAARENLLATYNNWALAEFDEGQFHTAKELLLRGLAVDPNYAPLLANDLHIHQQWIKHLCHAGDFVTAIELLEQGYLRRPDCELFDRGRIAVYKLWVQQQLDLPQVDL